MTANKKPIRVAETPEIDGIAAMEAQVAQAWVEYCHQASYDMKKENPAQKAAFAKHQELVKRLKEMKDAGAN